jgi:hypothetical protein
LQSDQVANQFRPDHTRESFEQNCFARTRRPARESGETTRAVATHLGFTAISVVIAHPKVRAVRRLLEDENAVRAHAAMAIAQARNLFARERKLSGTIIEHYEIVPGAIHFRETEHVPRG